MLACFPMRVDAELAGVFGGVETAYPAPEVSSLAGLVPPGGWPGPVEKLAADASELGWRVRRQWARGCLPHATTGAPGASRDSYAVRMAREDADGTRWAAWALYRGEAWKSVWMWGSDLLPFGLAGVTDLREWLADPAGCGQRWRDRIRARVAQQEAARKAAAAVRPRTRREGMS
jgi:hypothetical protein